MKIAKANTHMKTHINSSGNSDCNATITAGNVSSGSQPMMPRPRFGAGCACKEHASERHIRRSATQR